MASIGFVGASGLMGHGMAKNLLAKGHALTLTVHRNQERVADLLAAGAKQAPGFAQMAAGVDFVIICVTGSPQVEAVVTGPGGLLEGARTGLMIIDASTAEPDSTARLREVCAAKGVSFVDAPLSRTPVEAEAGRLNVLVGASGPDYARIEPILKAYAENVFHMGPPGTGHIVKLLNNFIVQATCNAMAEAFAVGTKAGVDLKKLLALMSLGPAASGLLQIMGKTLDGTLDGMKFELNNARKDVRYYTHLAENLNIPTVMGEATHQSLAMACALGFGTKLVPSLVEAQEKINSVSIVPR
ncbi:MAG: NAD(P)-dependent oxidoreductase [Rubrivivax sp.]